MFKIEKDVPLPTTVGKGGTSKYPFRQMEVGDSFRVEGPVTAGQRNSISHCAASVGKRTGRMFTTRLQPDGSVRIWRVA